MQGQHRAVDDDTEINSAITVLASEGEMLLGTPLFFFFAMCIVGIECTL